MSVEIETNEAVVAQVWAVLGWQLGLVVAKTHREHIDDVHCCLGQKIMIYFNDLCGFQCFRNVFWYMQDPKQKTEFKYHVWCYNNVQLYWGT